jgi:hypothetical protein
MLFLQSVTFAEKNSQGSSLSFFAHRLKTAPHMREPPLQKTWEYSNITQPLSSYERGMPGRSYQTKPGLP